MLPANLFLIPSFLKAKTPDKLKELMLENNISKGAEFNYFDIQFVKNNWYAWFYEDISKPAVNKVISEVNNG